MWIKSTCSLKSRNFPTHLEKKPVFCVKVASELHVFLRSSKDVDKTLALIHERFKWVGLSNEGIKWNETHRQIASTLEWRRLAETLPLGATQRRRQRLRRRPPRPPTPSDWNRWSCRSTSFSTRRLHRRKTTHSTHQIIRTDTFWTSSL